MPTKKRLEKKRQCELQYAASKTRKLEAFFNGNGDQQTINEGPEESAASPSETVQDRQEPKNAPRKTKLETLKSWGFDWLGFTVDGGNYVTEVWCQTCKEANEKRAVSLKSFPWSDSDAFVKGTKNVKKDTAKCHEQSQQHALAMKAVKPSTCPRIYKHLTKMDQKTFTKMCKLFDWAYTVAYTEQPFTIFPTLVNIEKKHGADMGETYANDKACSTFVKEIGEHLKDNLKKEFLDTPFYFSLIFDGSTDKTLTEKEIISIQLLQEGKPTVKLLGITEPAAGDAETITDTILERCQQVGLDLQSCVGVAADGASVNFGKKSGVLTRLEQKIPWLVKVHCVAHRLELALTEAFKNSFYTEIDELMLNLYYMYKRSPKKWRELKNVGEALGESVLKPVRSQGTRWVEHRRKALRVFKQNYQSLVTQFAEMGSGVRKDISGEDQAKMRGYLKLMTTHKFVLFLASYLDLVEDLAELSLSLQQMTVALPNVRLMIEVTQGRLNAKQTTPGENLSKVLQLVPDEGELKYNGVTLKTVPTAVASFQTQANIVLEKVQDCVNSRFSNLQDDPVFQASDILIPSNYPTDASSLNTYGIVSVTTLVDHFKVVLEQNGCSTDSIQHEWNVLKFDVSRNHRKEAYLELWARLFFEKPQYRNVLHLFRILLVIPVSSAHVERQFSFVKRALGDWRLSMGAETLETLLRIKLEGPKPEDFNTEPAVDRWRNSSVRSRRPNTMPYGPRVASEKTVEVIDCDSLELVPVPES